LLTRLAHTASLHAALSRVNDVSSSSSSNVIVDVILQLHGFVKNANTETSTKHIIQLHKNIILFTVSYINRAYEISVNF